ncbi:unnamed protein product, partial [Closterium sp. Naga37s-1]
PRAFAIDLSLLEQRYKQLQKMLHPDLHGGRSQEERELSAEQAAHVIDAYYTLLRPLSRAKYLLRASGVTAAELSGDSPGRDQQLLMEVMELRETIEDADSPEELKELQLQVYAWGGGVEGEGEGEERVLEMRETIEDADSPEELQAPQSQVGTGNHWSRQEMDLGEREPETQERMEGLYGSFDSAFRGGDVGACVGLLHRMAYFHRVANEIDNRLHSM